MKRIPDIDIDKDKWGNLYITKGKATHYPCIAAHMDQVQRIHGRDFTAIETEDIIFGYSPKNRRQEGLGADDKNGIWIALQCLKKYKVLKIALFTGEEIGCIGSSHARMEFFEDTRFVIQPDRRGFGDCITSIAGISLCSEEFIKDIGLKNFGYRETDGMMTDILALKERGLAVSCINLSCGYYEAHTDMEFTVKKDLLNCLRLVEHIIENCNNVYAHKGELIVTESIHEQEMNETYDAVVDEIFEMLDIDPGLSVDDLLYMYQTNYPELEREDFKRIYNEYFNLENYYYGR